MFDDTFISLPLVHQTKLYRDCLRLVRHVAPGQSSAKSIALRRTVRTEFIKHRHEQNQERIQALQANAIRALSNYMLAMHAIKDPKVAGAAQDFHGRSVKQANKEQQESVADESDDSER